MTSYLVYSIYSYIASVISWRIEKLYKKQNEVKTKEEKNNMINKLITVIQIYVDKETHIEKTKKTKLIF